MLDNLGVFVSTIVMLFVIVRAAQMDGSNPWYESLPKPGGLLAGLAKAKANAANRIPIWRKLK